MATWKTGGKRGLPINLTKAWDTGAARQRLWDFFEWDGNDPPNASGGKTRQAFLMYDADDPGLKGSYSLPFCDIVDGKLTALASGCRAAASRLPQKDGVSDEERTKARAILDDYFARIEEMQRAIDSGSSIEEAQSADQVLNVRREDYEETVLDEVATAVTSARTPPADAILDSSTPAAKIASPDSENEERSFTPRIYVRSEDITEARKTKPVPRLTFGASRQTGGDDDDAAMSIFAHPAAIRGIDTRARTDLLTLAKERAFDPALLDSVQPFFWGAEISSTRIDAYFTRMALSTLRNYATEAKAGVSFQNSHNIYELGLGRSLTGRFFNGDVESEDTPPRVEASFFTIPGLSAGGTTTEQFMLGVNVGLYKDVSVGFYGGTMRCSICQRDIWDWDCMHVPGMQYELRDEQGEKTGKREIAIAWIEDAHLAEVSIVYDGATPGAAILKAQQEAEAGRLNPAMHRVLEARYRIKLPGAERRFAGVEIPKREADMGNDPTARESTSSPAPAGEDTELTPVTTDPTPVEETRDPSPREVIAAAVGATEAATETIREVTVNVSDGGTTIAISPSPEDGQQAPATEERSPVEAIFEESGPAPAAIPVAKGELATDVAVAGNGADRSNGTVATLSPPAAPDPAIAQMATVRAALTEVGVPTTVDPVKAIRSLAAKVLELTPRARDGQQYRIDLIEDTLGEGTRAHGVDWDPSTWRAVLQGASLDQIKAIREDFRGLAKKNFQGGRATVETEQEPSALEALESGRATPQAGDHDPFWPDDELPSAAFSG
jgi:hypothetical protein